jgi:antitoxin HigA-1
MKTTPTAPIKRTGPGPKIHPGHLLRKYVLEERKLTQSAFAAMTGLPVSRINDIIKGRRGITMDMALRFGKVIGTGEQLWLNLQASYDRAIALEAKGPEYAALKPLPLEQAA